MKHFTVYETLSQITSDLHVSFVAWVTEGSTLDPERVRRLPAQAGSSGPRGTLSAGGCHLGRWLRELIHLPFSLPPPESWVSGACGTERSQGRWHGQTGWHGGEPGLPWAAVESQREEDASETTCFCENSSSRAVWEIRPVFS